MRKKLIPIGNSLGIVIEKPILELLGFDRETELEVETDGERLILSGFRSDAPPAHVTLFSPPTLRYGPNNKQFPNIDFVEMQHARIAFGPAVTQPDGSIRNPKKGEPRKRFDKYVAGMSVAEALAAGITGDDIRWDLKKGFITLRQAR